MVDNGDTVELRNTEEIRITGGDNVEAGTTLMTSEADTVTGLAPPWKQTQESSSRPAIRLCLVEVLPRLMVFNSTPL